MFCFLLVVLLFIFFLARFIAVMSVCLVRDSSIVATYPSIPAARFASRLCFIRKVVVVGTCFIWRTKAEARARVGRPQTSSSPHPLPSNFIAGRRKAALLLWFFGDFRCGVLLFMVILIISVHNSKKSRKK